MIFVLIPVEKIIASTQTMNANDLRAELGLKMLELEKAIDLGMPYSNLKTVYSEIKKL